MRKLRLTACITTISVLAGTFPVFAESLKSALGVTYDSNPTLNIQRAQVRALDETLVQAKSPFRPNVFFSVNQSLIRQVNRGGFGGTTANTIAPNNVGVTIQQSLFNGFQTINSIQAAKANIYAARENLRNVEQDILFNAATAYADVILAKETVSIRRRDISFLREQVRSSQARLDVGEGTRTDLAQSQAQLALARAQLSAAQANLDSARATYRQIVGRPPRNLRDPRPPVRLYPANLQRALSISAVEHPIIKASQHLVDFAAFNVRQAEGQYLPSVTLEGRAEHSDDLSGVTGSTSAARATINLNVPIYQQGTVSSQVRQNRETLGQRRIEVDQSRDQVRNNVVASWTTLISSRATIRSNQAQVRAARLALEGVIEERNVGQRTQLEVLQAQSAVLDAQLLLVQARRNRIVAGYALLSSIGRLSAARLGLNVRLHNPREHFNKTKDRWYGLRTPSGR